MTKTETQTYWSKLTKDWTKEQRDAVGTGIIGFGLLFLGTAFWIMGELCLKHGWRYICG